MTETTGETETDDRRRDDDRRARSRATSRTASRCSPSAGCGGCHTLAAAGTNGSVGPNLDDASPSYDKVVERVTNGQGAMPSFKDDLSAQEINDVAAFVSSSVDD